MLESSYACQFMKLLMWATHPHTSVARKHFTDGMAGYPSLSQSFCEIREVSGGDGADEVIILAPEERPVHRIDAGPFSHGPGGGIER